MTDPTAISGQLARNDRDSRRTMRDFTIASTPAALIGTWALGRQILASREAADPLILNTVEAAIWQLGVLDTLGLASTGALAASVLGLLVLAPPLLIALAVSRGWAELFARLRHRPLDPSWALAAWLFVLLLPAGMPLHLVALGVSFGAVFGCHVFGGTGKYLVNPALLGAVFLLVAYPSRFVAGAWVPGTDLLPMWQIVATGGVESAELAWINAFAGLQVGAIGTPSALACALGAFFLIARGRTSWRSVAGAIAGVAIAGWTAQDLPWHWQPVLGSFAFAAAFLLTDPTTTARTVPGIWSQAILFGMLTVLIRMSNPDHPEGTLFALLLAVLCTPLLDHLAVRWQIVLRRRRHAR